MNHELFQTTARVASGHRELRETRTFWSCFILSIFVLLVAACGGGGGDAGSGSGAGVTAPVITVQPASVSSVVGGPAVFSVVADGNGIAYQWQRNVNNGLSWLDVAGASGASYTVAAVNASMNGDQYRVILQNIAGLVVSAPATLSVATVAGGPSITSQPADLGVSVGATANFAVTATGTTLNYRWQRSTDGLVWTDIPGATTATLGLVAVTLADSGAKVRVVVSNSADSVTSRAATLTVTAGGGGGGGGGVPTDCVPANVLPVGMVVRTSYALDLGGIAGTPQQATMTVVGPATFQGRSVFETRIDTTGTFVPGVFRAFSTWEPTSRMLTPWGAISHLEVGSTMADITSVARQPAQYPVYALAVGQSATVTAVSDNTQVVTVNGVAGAPQTSVDTTTTTYTFLGTETLTVPAGTFLTCKVREQAAGVTQPTTNWLMAGYGATVKSVTGTTTQTLTAITVNGTPLAHFP